MTSREFAFWCQGFFEISEAEEVTSEQIKVINKHVDLVFAYDKQPSEFMRYMQRILKINSITTQAGEAEWSKEQVADVKAKLNDLFVHVIDPSYGNSSVQSHLNSIHGNRPGGPIMRC